MQQSIQRNNRKMKNPMMPMCNPEIAKIWAVPDFINASRIFCGIADFVPVIIAFATAAEFFSIFSSICLLILCRIFSICVDKDDFVFALCTLRGSETINPRAEI